MRSMSRTSLNSNSPSTFQPPTAPTMPSGHVGERRGSFIRQLRSWDSRRHRNHDAPPNYTDVVFGENGRSDYPSVVEGKKVEALPPAYLTVAPSKKGARF
ncbi:hypothetical protein CDAR_260391 [Caerostris darwini]|uniref:Uncharacterized protein n=1 Tax=Caerostris darwini TaxID=1538125 RepID=A0AAV4NQP7_9ARAC|nr:hypothetical protein CDAR_260391 [Caerostris darwini]